MSLGSDRPTPGSDGDASPPIAEKDVRAIVRLLGETLAHAGDDRARKRFLLGGLAKLVEADVWVWVVQKRSADTGEVAYFSMIDGGWTSDRQRGIATGAAWDPAAKPFHDLMAAPGYAALRSDHWNDEAWYGSQFFKRYREPAGLDDAMGAGFFVTPEIASAIGLHRHLGRPPFGERERQIAQIVTTEVAWLHRAGIPEKELPPVDEMSPRLRHVMLLLVGGSARKAIATELGISLHTVNEYVAQVYARVGVHSRAELMARFIGGARGAGG